MPNTKLHKLANSEYKRMISDQKNYKVLEKKIQNDSRFGTYQLWKNQKTKEDVIVKEKIFSNKKSAGVEIHSLKQKMRDQHPNTLQLVDWGCKTKKSLCSTQYVVKALYKMPTTDGEKLQKKMIEQQEGVSGETMYKMGLDSLQGLANMHKDNRVHGNINPSYIGYYRDQDTYALTENLNDQNLMDKVQVQNLIQKKDLFMSPELYSKLETKNKKMKVDGMKNDTFALGMSLLKIGNGKSLKSVYGVDGKFNQDELDQQIALFENKYKDDSPLACQLMNNLVESDVSRREAPIKILEKLQSTQNKIQEDVVEKTEKISLKSNEDQPSEHLEEELIIEDNLVEQNIKKVNAQLEEAEEEVKEEVAEELPEPVKVIESIKEDITEPVTTFQPRTYVVETQNENDVNNINLPQTNSTDKEFTTFNYDSKLNSTKKFTTSRYGRKFKVKLDGSVVEIKEGVEMPIAREEMGNRLDTLASQMQNRL